MFITNQGVEALMKFAPIEGLRVEIRDTDGETLFQMPLTESHKAALIGPGMLLRIGVDPEMNSGYVMEGWSIMTPIFFWTVDEARTYARRYNLFGWQKEGDNYVILSSFAPKVVSHTLKKVRFA